MTARHKTPDELLARLAELGISAETHRHARVFTVEESKALRGDLPGGHCKSLFLKDKKDALWLVVALEDRAVDLKALRHKIGAQTLSFGKPETMRAVLGVEPGSVTPFALVNETAAAVTIVLDQAMMSLELLNYHPLSNDMTTAIRPADLIRFLEAHGHAPRIVDLS